MGNDNEFWLVWNPRGGSPTYRHDTQESAKNEAERLAMAHGGEFFVLRAVARCERKMVMWTALNDSEIPF